LGQNEIGLGGPVRNWTCWASTELDLVGQYEIGLGGLDKTGLEGPVQNRA